MEKGIHYINDGDWVENCSALGEDMEGNLSLIYYLEEMESTNNVTPIKAKASTSKAA